MAPGRARTGPQAPEAASNPGAPSRPSTAGPSPHRTLTAFDRGFLFGAALSALIFGALAADFTRWDRQDGRLHYFTGAAINLLHGKLYVGRFLLSILSTDRLNGSECFLVKGHCYGYFGLWPSAVRVPLVLIGGYRSYAHFPELLFFLLAFATLAAGVWWLARQLARAWTPEDRRPGGLAGFAIAVATLVASPVLFQVSTPLMYQEAILWGLGFAFAGLAAALDIWFRGPRRASVAGLVAANLCAMLSHPTIGASALLATAVLAAVALAPGRFARHWASPVSRTWRMSLVLLGGGILAVASIPAVSLAKFGTLAPPYRDNVVLQGNAERLARYVHTGDISLKLVPTKLYDALRPDTVGVQGQLPYFYLNEPPVTPTAIWPATAQDLDWVGGNANVSTSLPFLALLSLAGLFLLALRVIKDLQIGARRTGARRSTPQRRVVVAGTLLVLASALAALVLELGYPGQTYRYQAAWVPTMVIAATVGLAVLSAHAAQRTVWRGGLAVGVGALLTLQLAIQGEFTVENGLNRGSASLRCDGQGISDGPLETLFCRDL